MLDNDDKSISAEEYDKIYPLMQEIYKIQQAIDTATDDVITHSNRIMSLSKQFRTIDQVKHNNFEVHSYTMDIPSEYDMMR
jgi:hypothetical protein